MCAGNCIPAIKLFAISKTAKLEFLFVFLVQIRVVLAVFRGALGVPNFFVTSLCTRNYIPTIKLLAISKTAKLEFFANFEGEWGWLNVLHGTCIAGNFFITSL